MKTSMLAATTGLLLAACGGGGGDDPTPSSPHALPGGGVTGNAAHGSADVFVMDDAGQPLSNADVWLGEGATARAVGQTNGSGHLAFQDPEAIPGMVLAATASGHVGASYAGIEGSIVTFVLPSPATTPNDITITGTIEGWDALPAPAVGKYRAARVVASRPVALATLDAISPISTDDCFRSTTPSECAFSLSAYPSSELVIAVIVEGDDAGTPSDPADDVLQVTAIATAAGPGAGGPTSGMNLTIADPLSTATTVVGLSSSTGWTHVIGVPGVTLSSQVTVFPSFDAPLTTYLIPKPEADFQNAKLWAVGAASDDLGARSLVVTRGLDPVSPSLPLADFPRRTEC